MIKKFFFAVILTFIFGNVAIGQGASNYDGGLKVKFDKEGDKYLRIILWGQIQAGYSNTNGEGDALFQLKRARVLMFSQLTDKFLILTHFGLNNLSPASLSPTGKGEGSQLFLHGMWAQYNPNKNHSIGAGLHYFNGISRLNNQSTLNFLTLDNNRQSWATLGLSDQFARHLGVFSKGSFNKFQYQLAINSAIVNGLDSRTPSENLGENIYAGKANLDNHKADFNYAGYFKLDLLDKESNFLPYKVGTYLGSKKVLSIGTGFYAHPNAVVKMDNLDDELTTSTAGIVAVDIFYDAPIKESTAAITAYGVYQYNNYGKDYKFSAYGTGSMAYTHLGFLIPSENKKIRFQPYASYALNTYQAIDDNLMVLGLGSNLFFNAHHSKLTVEYKNQRIGNSHTNSITLQAMIYL